MCRPHTSCLDYIVRFFKRLNFYQKQKKMQDAGVKAVEIFWDLEDTVREDIYDYITSENFQMRHFLKSILEGFGETD